MPKTVFTKLSAPHAVGRFRAVAVGCAVLAAAFPGLALLARGEAVALLPALAGSLVAVALLARLLQPLSFVAARLGDCLSDQPRETPPGAAPSAKGAGGMVGQAVELAGRVDRMRQRLANGHPVTGLPTREPFLSDLAADMQGQDRRLVLGVVRFADYDRLAAFDQAGADLALKTFAERLRGCLAQSRPLAQVDRDCFAAEFRDAARDEVERELQALAYVLGQELTAGSLTLTPQVGIGAAVFPGDGAAPGELLTRAIAALEGPDRREKTVIFFSAQGSDAARERFSLEQDLRGAAGRDQLALHFQPLVDAEAGRIVGAEALLRWRHPELGWVPPGRFIPILEQSTAMAEVGLWVLNAACREAKGWRERGLGELKVAVNLSTIQCRDPRLPDMVLRTLDRHDLPASSLELELTETAAMEDAERTGRLLAALRAEGVGVAVDDFGAGYSNLSYLKNLPFSKLKIDREFVTALDQRRDSRAICGAVIALSRGLDMALVAEGVERIEEVATLRSLGCHLFQGFYFARPLDAPGFIEQAEDQAWLDPLIHPAPRAVERTIAG